MQGSGCSCGREVQGEQGSVQQQAVAESPWPVQALCKSNGFLLAHSHRGAASYSVCVYFHSLRCNWPRLLCQEPPG